MKDQTDYSQYECPYSHLKKECGHELHGPEGYEQTYGVWCSCGFRGPVFYLNPAELGLKKKDAPQEKAEPPTISQQPLCASDNVNKDNVLTCVYCGKAYLSGTPTHEVSVLTEHIKVCPKHPLRKAEKAIRKLRAALAGLIGESDITLLKNMEAVVRTLPVPEADKIASINGINALIETDEYK